VWSPSRLPPPELQFPGFLRDSFVIPLFLISLRSKSKLFSRPSFCFSLGYRHHPLCWLCPPESYWMISRPSLRLLLKPSLQFFAELPQEGVVFEPLFEVHRAPAFSLVSCGDCIRALPSLLSMARRTLFKEKNPLHNDFPAPFIFPLIHPDFFFPPLPGKYSMNYLAWVRFFFLPSNRGILHSLCFFSFFSADLSPSGVPPL